MAQQKVREIEIVEEDVTVSADLLRQDITIRRQAVVEYVDDGGRRLRESTIMEIPYLDSWGEPLASNWRILSRRSRPDGHPGLAVTLGFEHLSSARRSGLATGRLRTGTVRWLVAQLMRRRTCDGELVRGSDRRW